VFPTATERTMLLEAIYVLETIAAPRLHADRFLPPTPIRLVVSHKLEEVTEAFSGATWERKLQKGSPHQLMQNADIARQTLPAMFESAARHAEIRATAIRGKASEAMNHLLGHEVLRLQTLAQVNDHMRPEEIQLARSHQEELAKVLELSRVRLDCLRLIWKGPADYARTVALIR